MPLTTIKSTSISGNTINKIVVATNGISLTANSTGTVIITLNVPHPFMLMGV
jgi:hypothetical protein